MFPSGNKLQPSDVNGLRVSAIDSLKNNDSIKNTIMGDKVRIWVTFLFLNFKLSIV